MLPFRLRNHSIDELVEIAQRANTSDSVLAELAEHDDKSVRHAALQHPRTPTHVLRRQADSGDYGNIVAVVFNPKAPVDILEREIRFIEYAHFSAEGPISRLTEKHTRRIARNPSTPVDALHRIVQLPKGDDHVICQRVAAVADNPQATPDVLIAAAMRIPTGVHLTGDQARAFYSHKQADDNVLRTVFDKVKSKSKRDIAGLEACGDLTVSKILHSRSQVAKAIIVKRFPDLSAQMLANIQGNHNLLQENIAKHRNVSADTLRELSSSPHAVVRKEVSKHPRTPGDVHTMLAFDSVPEVAAEATKVLAERRAEIHSRT